MFPKNPKEISFFGVAILVLLAGAAIFAYGVVAWLFNVYQDTGFAIPSLKIIGGLVVMSLGYIQLEIELLRRG